MVARRRGVGPGRELLPIESNRRCHALDEEQGADQRRWQTTGVCFQGLDCSTVGEKSTDGSAGKARSSDDAGAFQSGGTTSRQRSDQTNNRRYLGGRLLTGFSATAPGHRRAATDLHQRGASAGSQRQADGKERAPAAKV